MLPRREWLETVLWSALGLATGCYAQPPKPYPYPATPDEERRARIGERVKAFQAGTPDAGVAVGLLERGVPRVYGFGRTTYHEPRPPSADALFELGTTSEVLVGALLADLVARKRARFDQPARELLPQSVKLPTHGEREITLADLALHTSGLPADVAPDGVKDEAALAMLLAARPLETAPGERYQPSALGMALLAWALGLREGRAFGDLVRERVTLPLGMLSTTTFRRDVAFDESRLVEGRDASGRLAPQRFQEPLLAASSLRTSVNDLLRLAAALLDPTSSAAATTLARAVERRRPLADGSEVRMGLRASPRDGVLWQTGATPAFQTGLWVSPESSRAVVLAVASRALDARGLLFELARADALPSDRTLPPRGPVLSALPPDAIRADVVLERLVRFAGYRSPASVARPGELLRVTLYFQCLAPIDRDLQVMVLGADESGRTVVDASHYPAAGRYSTRSWRTGEVVADEFDLAIPADTRASRITLWLGLTSTGRALGAAPGPNVDLAGRIQGPSLEIVRPAR